MSSNFNVKIKECAVLTSDEVHIWLASLSEDKNDIDYFTSLLSQDERERASSFRFSKDQHRYTISRGILRTLLAEYLGEAPRTIEITYGLWGKPCLSQEKSLHFNLSHSGDHVLYALALDYEVGIDLEYIDRNLEIEDMAKHIFSAPELEFWEDVKPEERTECFFKLWVCKEAFLKAIGKGWLENEKTKGFEKSLVLNKISHNGLLKDKVTYPYFFECVPGYASALFVDGASLCPLHYNWHQSIFK